MKEGPRRSDELGVVFDMDGVLIASMEFHGQAFVEILASLGIDGFSYSRFAGWRTPDVFRTVFSEADLTVTEDEITKFSGRKSARSRELLERQDQLFKDCVPVVSKLSATYPLALASSGSRGSVQTFLEKSGLRGVFRAVVTGDDVTRAKPNPEIFVRAIACLNLAPARCIVVEDAAAGIEAACAAGAIACGFGPDSSGVLRQAGASCFIDSLSQLPQFLEGFLKKTSGKKRSATA